MEEYMKKLVPVISILLILNLLVLAQMPSEKTKLPSVISAEVTGRNYVLQDQDIDWSKVSPIEFLELLQEQDRLGPIPIFSVWSEPPSGWIKEAHVEVLLRLVNSKKPAAHVVKAISSHLPTKNSTVGVQAMYLIEGFRKGHYPTLLSSEDFKGNPSEYRKWWRRVRSAGTAPSNKS
jgi:hypothetical protein